ncbi:hypothetical protein Hanom_Chr04g00332861 [Helianthus anomalus]
MKEVDIPKEQKYKRPLAFFTRHLDASLGDILSWDTKTLPWWDVEELVPTKLIQTNILNEVRFHEARLWGVIKYQAMIRFPDWKPHYPKKIVKIDPVTGEKDVTLHIKRP